VWTQVAVVFKYEIGEYVSILGQEPPRKFIVAGRDYSEYSSGNRAVTYTIRPCDYDNTPWAAVEADLVPWAGKEGG
jgi:hypothetical protein